MRFGSFFPVIGVLFVLSLPVACKDVQDDAGTEVKIEKTFDERVAEVEAQIRNTPEWLRTVEQKAAEKNIALDSMIRLDAEWLVREGGNANEPAGTDADAGLTQKIQEAEQKIRNDKVWLQAIEQKARERNISVDSMIRIDARFIVEEQIRQGK